MKSSFLYFVFLGCIHIAALAQETKVVDTELTNKANQYYTAAYNFSINHKKDSAYYFYKKANEIYVAIPDSLRIGDTLLRLAILQSDLGDYSGSDKTGVEALKYIDKENEVYLTAIYNCLAISSRKQHDYTEALYWYDKAIKMSSNEGYIIKYLQNKANAFRDLKQYNNSIAILDSLSKVPIKSKKTKARIIDNLAYTKWLNGDKTTVLKKLEEALKIRLVENDLWGLVASYAHLSEFYKHTNSKLSLVYAKEMYLLATRLKSPSDQLDALDKLISLDNSKDVKKYFASYLRINDSLKTAEVKTKNKFAKLKYDSEKNREENLELKIVTSQKELELEKEKTQNIIGAFSSGIVVLGLLLVGYYRKQKHTQEKRAEVYKTETRIAKKIHDEVANNVVNIMNKVQYTEEPKEKLLDDLEKVYLLTRNISHENNTVDTGSQFLASIKSLLQSFNNNSTTIILKNINNVELELISKEKQIEIYRVLQELMVNMQKHSNATLVALSFKKTNHYFFINYSDNGKGTELETLKSKNGLGNVETRINAIDGNITFESSLNKGFKVFISFKQ